MITVIAKSNEDIAKELTDVVQRHLDSTAQQRGYDGILSLCSYAASTNARFGIEGQAGVNWRDAVWDTCYQILTDTLAGTRQAPTAESIIAELPVLVWPTEAR